MEILRMREKRFPVNLPVLLWVKFWKISKIFIRDLSDINFGPFFAAPLREFTAI